MSPYLAPQPAPVVGTAEPTWAEVAAWLDRRAIDAGPGERAEGWKLLAADGRQRDVEGAGKYGSRHQHDNGRDHATDAYQEHLDACCYWWAEWRKTDHFAALDMFVAAAELAVRCRLYLRRRDGR